MHGSFPYILWTLLIISKTENIEILYLSCNALCRIEVKDTVTRSDGLMCLVVYIKEKEREIVWLLSIVNAAGIKLLVTHTLNVRRKGYTSRWRLSRHNIFRNIAFTWFFRGILVYVLLQFAFVIFENYGWFPRRLPK